MVGCNPDDDDGDGGFMTFSLHRTDSEGHVGFVLVRRKGLALRTQRILTFLGRRCSLLLALDLFIFEKLSGYLPLKQYGPLTL